jgi:predicted signal transduction protein with EAL and GGDEF domain
MGEKMRAALEQACMLDGQSYGCTSTIGITLLAQRNGAVDELLKRADVAMFQAKNEGRNTLRFFDSVMQAAVDVRAALEKELGVAVRDNHLRLYYQPQMNGVNTLVEAEAEALVRWEHPHRGLIAPVHFIGLAEETSLILPLGLWVLETACQRLAVWVEDTAMAHLTLAVNVSARQFNQPGFVEQVLSALARTGARARQLMPWFQA